jgi:hypothetical protein
MIVEPAPSFPVFPTAMQSTGGSDDDIEVHEMAVKFTASVGGV